MATLLLTLCRLMCDVTKEQVTGGKWWAEVVSTAFLITMAKAVQGSQWFFFFWPMFWGEKVCGGINHHSGDRLVTYPQLGCWVGDAGAPLWSFLLFTQPDLPLPPALGWYHYSGLALLPLLKVSGDTFRGHITWGTSYAVLNPVKLKIKTGRPTDRGRAKRKPRFHLLKTEFNNINRNIKV